MWYIDFKSFFTALNKRHKIRDTQSFHFFTSEIVRIPGQVVTTDALQRLCITHVQTKNDFDVVNHERIKIE